MKTIRELIAERDETLGKTLAQYREDAAALLAEQRELERVEQHKKDVKLIAKHMIVEAINEGVFTEVMRELHEEGRV